MGIRRDKVIVVDLEATCWKKQQPPPGEQNEIIEVGVCTLDTETLDIVDKRSLLVQPTRSTVSAFCTKLTSLTAEMLAEDGTTFEAACAVLATDYHAPNYLWGSWGGYDLRMFKDQTAIFGVMYPFSGHHVDIKGLYALHRNDDKRIGMARALKNENIEMEGRHHRGDADAFNTARLLALLIREHGIKILEPHWS